MNPSSWALVALLAARLLAPPQGPGWALFGAESGFTVRGAGLPTDSGGATISIRADQGSAAPFGVVMMELPLERYRRARIRVVADVETIDAATGASPWIRVDGAAGVLTYDIGFTNRVRGTSSGHREVTVFVPETATQLRVGLRLDGRGEASARGLRIEVRPRTALDSAVAPAAARELDSAIAVVRAHSLWRDTVTWSALLADVRGMARGAETAEDVHGPIEQLLWRLGDHHSFLMRPREAQTFEHGGATNPPPIVKVVGDRVGYVAVLAYSGEEATAMLEFAQGMQDSVRTTLTKASCKWIVDLRNNGGGNMWPMLGGLRPFLGDLPLGQFVGGTETGPPWHAKDFVDVKPIGALNALSSAYVAVLYSRWTASSGEAVAISFRGRPRTRSFGVPTAGLTTANQDYQLPDSSRIFLTESVEADRTGKRYGGKLAPDVMVPGNASARVDPPLAAALKWLGAQPACGK